VSQILVFLDLPNLVVELADLVLVKLALHLQLFHLLLQPKELLACGISLTRLLELFLALNLCELLLLAMFEFLHLDLRLSQEVLILLFNCLFLGLHFGHLGLILPFDFSSHLLLPRGGLLLEHSLFLLVFVLQLFESFLCLVLKESVHVLHVLVRLDIALGLGDVQHILHSFVVIIHLRNHLHL
jgi:hypothetical protein